jgi:molybdopterin synthase sulfur carrier subunit
MPVAVINRELARRFTNGETRLELTESAGADSIRGVIRALEALYPGIGPELRTGMAVAVDGEIFQGAALKKVSLDAEVCFLPSIEAG